MRNHLSSKDLSDLLPCASRGFWRTKKLYAMAGTIFLEECFDLTIEETVRNHRAKADCR